MSNFDDTVPTEGHQDLWHVQLATGEVREMSLEQLDDAFQSGLITEETFVYEQSLGKWAKLSDVLGANDSPESADEIDATEDVEAEEHSEMAASAAEPPTTPRPVAVPILPPIGGGGWGAAVPNSVPVPAPVVAAAPSIQIPSDHVLLRSTAPVVSEVLDVDTDFETVSFGKRKGRSYRWIAIAAVLGGVVFAAVKMGSGSGEASAEPSLAAAPAATAPAWHEPEPVVQPVAEPVKVAPSAADRLGEDTRRALADADKQRSEKAKSKRRAAPREPARTRTKVNSGPVFHKGGDAHDPLNSSL